jgi:amino acid transporter
MATVIFSCFWILLADTISSSKTVAINILSLANPDMPTSDIPDGQIRFTAVVVQTVVCLLLFFARRLCFLFNTTFAFYKIILLLFIFIAGMKASGGRGYVGFKDFDKEYSGYNGVDALTAMIYIIFSYQGWDNANYVRNSPLRGFAEALTTEDRRRDQRLQEDAQKC